MNARNLAAVIPLPGASSTPVLQHKTRGRHPKSVTTLTAHLRKKFRAQIDNEAQEQDRRLILKELELQRRLEEIDVRARAGRAWKIMRMSTPPKTAQEAKELAAIVAEIKWWNLPFEERQRIEAQQLGRGQVLCFPPERLNIAQNPVERHAQRPSQTQASAKLSTPGDFQ